MALQETLIREIQTLLEPRMVDVLAFVRFLKIGLADEQTMERRFVSALARARTLAAERGITERDIAEEIEAVRAGA